jgi:hypothetical protein
MAAQPWKVYNLAKKKIGNTSLNLASTAFRITLHTSASNAATLTLGVYNSVTNEVTEANGYSSSGKACTSEVWTVGASAKQYKFDVDDVVWTGTGGAIANIKFAVLWISAASTVNRHLLAFCSLTSAQFTLAQNNTLTLQMNSAGVLTLV